MQNLHPRLVMQSLVWNTQTYATKEPLPFKPPRLADGFGRKVSLSCFERTAIHPKVWFPRFHCLELG
ncbi:hypothetical protein J5TS2_43530 [Brevibacillus halotolerans]|nr:hypothetical protein J5TS2_43530 [Brevibacillus halotolerans]